MKVGRISGTVAIVISSVALVLVVLVGWFAFISPQRAKADTLDTQQAAAETELATDQSLLSAPRRKQTKLEAAAASLALPDQPQISAILRQLSALAAQSRTELDNITPGSPVSTGSAEAIPISLTFKGKYFGLQKLLKLLRQSADVRNGKIVGHGRLFTVDNIQFSGGQADELAASISLNAFVYGASVPVVAPTPETTTTATGP